MEALRDSELAQPIRMAEAARRLGITTRQVVRLLHGGELRYVLVDGMAHVPEDSIEEFRSRTTA